MLLVVTSAKKPETRAGGSTRGCRRTRAEAVRDQARRAVLPDGDQAVRRAQVDTDDHLRLHHN
jgi:hypothetical protein